MKNYLSLVLMLVSVLVTNLGYAQGIAKLSGPTITIQKDEFGFNCQNYFDGPSWKDNDFQHTVTRLMPGNLRYPGGTIANFWDWRTGTIIEEKTKGFPNYQGTEFAYTPKDFVEGIPKGTEIVYVVNMARPTAATKIPLDTTIEVLESREILDLKIVDILAAIQEFSDAGHPLKYIELGNEFYNGASGAPNSSGGIYSSRVGLYIEHVNILADTISQVFPDAELAVIGDAYNEDSEDIDQTDTGISAWTDSIYTAIEEGRLNNIDAITFHWYTGPGVATLDSDSLVERSLNQTFKKQRQVQRTDFETNRLGLDLWITEYNTFSQPRTSKNPNNPGNGGAIQGSWTNGMFGANLTLLYTMLGPSIKLLDIHVLSVNNLQWAMLQDKNTLSGNGVALSLVGTAMKDMDKAREVKFRGITNPTFGEDGDPSLYAVKFWNGKKETMIVVNNTKSAKNNVNISWLFWGLGNKRKTVYYDTTPYVADRLNADTSRVSEDQGLTYDYEDDLGNVVGFPPFSITVIEQDKINLVANSSFETNTGWSRTNFIEDNIKNAYTGNRALQLTTTSQRFSGSLQTVSVWPNQPYLLSAKIRTALSSGAGRLKVRFLNARNQEVGSPLFSNDVQGTNSYREISESFVTPYRATKLEITLQLANGTGTVWFDDVLLRWDYRYYPWFRSESLSTHDNSDGLVLYPNPAVDGTFKLQLDGSHQLPDVIEIKDMTGKLVKYLAKPTSEDVKTEGLGKGMYIIIATYNGNKYSEKLIVE